jgi:SPP1 family predicted phage head-tail adaptor
MNAGRLQHRIDVEEAVETQDGDGDPVVAWSSLGTVWGAVAPVRGRESHYAGDQTLAETDTRITLRYGPLTKQISAKHRLVHQGTPFNVSRVVHVDLANREIEIMATSGVNDG